MSDSDRLIALVDDLLKQPHEVSWLEFKVDNFEHHKIGTLISAISNAARLADRMCGYVIWGVEDGTHQVVGTKFQVGKEQAKGQPLEFWLHQHVSPSLPFSFKEVLHPSGRVVILEIPSALQVPTKFDNIAYIRIGETTPKLADHLSQETSLLEKLRPFAWEHGTAMSFVRTEEVIGLLDVAAYFASTEQAVPGSDEGIASVLAQERLIQRDVGGRWNILNVGAVLFAKDLSRFEGIKRKAVRVVKYDSTTRGVKTKEQVGTRGYAIGFSGLVDYVNRLLPHEEVVRRALRMPRAVYPEIAVRELLANALVHQDMTIGGAGPLIEIFTDRVEITNPGSPLVPTDRFIDYPPLSRNQAVASLMRRVGVCEELGSGIDKVVAAIEQAILPAPSFREDGRNMRVVLFGPKRFSEMTQEERVSACYLHAVLKHVDNEGMTNSTLRTRFGVAERNAAQISRVIRQAMDAGLIKQSESFNARTGHYLPFWA